MKCAPHNVAAKYEPALFGSGGMGGMANEVWVSKHATQGMPQDQTGYCFPPIFLDPTYEKSPRFVLRLKLVDTFGAPPEMHVMSTASSVQSCGHEMV